MTNRIEAYAAIANLIASYCFAMDEGRIDDLLDLFASEGSFEIYGCNAVGRDAILAMLRASGRAARGYGQRVRPHHIPATPLVDLLDESSATARTYVQVVTDEGVDHCATYDDLFSVEQGRWRIARRKITVITKRPGGLGAHLAQTMVAA